MEVISHAAVELARIQQKLAHLVTVIRCGISAPGRLVHRALPPSAGARSPACRHAAGTWPGQASEAGPEGGSEAAGLGAVVS